MATALFISPSQIKEQAFVDENVDDKYLINSIIYCQEEYTKSICGTALYNEIKGQIETGTLTSNNTTLRDTYLRPALKWWVMYDCMDMLNIKITNKAVVKKRSENSDPVDLTEILHLKNQFRDKAERLDEKSRLFLTENSSTYPLYLNPGSGADTINPKGFTYGTGWYLGGTNTDSPFETDEGNECY